MASTVQVSDTIWNWIRLTVPLEGSMRESFELWRSGEKLPTFNQLEAFSNRTRIPLGYFFLQSPPVSYMRAWRA